MKVFYFTGTGNSRRHFKRQNKLVSKGIVSNTLSKFAHMYADKMGNNYGNKNFIVNDNCTSCKVCEKVCPTNNIIVSKKPEFMHKYLINHCIFD